MSNPPTTVPAPATPAAASTGLPAPIWAVLLLTFLGSVGSGAVTNGIFFITDSGLGYGRGMNLALGCVFGLTYIAGALLAGASLRRLAARVGWITTRGVLSAILAVMGLACQLPFLTARLTPDHLGLSVWVMVLIYSPATGVLWPIIESYLSGGRREKDLRGALGLFNIVWSSALVAAYWAMAPLVKDNPFTILVGLGAIHLAMAGLVFLFPKEPGHHDAHAQPHPPVYESLLALFRVLLFASYLVLSAVNPIQPMLLDRIGVDKSSQTLVASAWLISRVAVFALFERWHGWHGKWWTPWTGLACMILGFALTVGAPALGGLALTSFITGLALTGCGVAAIYCGALYYAMAVGTAGVDAGGKHEAVIGLGYTIGPLLGLGALGIAGFRPGDPNAGDPESFRLWTIGLTALSAGLLGAWGYRVARRAARSGGNTPH